jgi:hypothetical protein
MNNQIKWFCHHTVEEGWLTAEQCQLIADAFLEQGVKENLGVFVQTALDNGFCTDVARLNELAELSVVEAKTLGGAPDGVFGPLPISGPEQGPSQRKYLAPESTPLEFGGSGSEDPGTLGVTHFREASEGTGRKGIERAPALQRWSSRIGPVPRCLFWVGLPVWTFVAPMMILCAIALACGDSVLRLDDALACGLGLGVCVYGGVLAAIFMASSRPSTSSVHAGAASDLDGKQGILNRGARRILSLGARDIVGISKMMVLLSILCGFASIWCAVSLDTVDIVGLAGAFIFLALFVCSLASSFLWQGSLGRRSVRSAVPLITVAIMVVLPLPLILAVPCIMLLEGADSREISEIGGSGGDGSPGSSREASPDPLSDEELERISDSELARLLGEREERPSGDNDSQPGKAKDGELVRAEAEHERYMEQADSALDTGNRLIAAGDLKGSYLQMDRSNDLIYSAHIVMIKYWCGKATGGDEYAKGQLQDYARVLRSAHKREENMLWGASKSLNRAAVTAHAREDPRTGLFLFQLANGRLDRRKEVNTRLVQVYRQSHLP